MSGRVPDLREQIASLRELLSGEPTAHAAPALFQAARLAEETGDAIEALGALPVDVGAELHATADAAIVRAAELGHAPAAEEIAWRIYQAGQAERAEEAFALASQAEATANGQYLLGLFRFSGFGCEKQPDASLVHHRSAAERGHADAMFELYVFHSHGIGTRLDFAEAIGWCQKAAEAGNARAMANLGGFYMAGNGVPQDEAKAVHWFREAAERGDGRAAAMLGVMCLQGQGMELDRAQGWEWIARARRLGFDPARMLQQIGIAEPASAEG